MFKYSIKRDVYLFRTDIVLTLQSKDDSLLRYSLLCHQSVNYNIYHPLLPWRNTGKWSYQNYEQHRHSDTAPSWQGNFIIYTWYALSCCRKGLDKPEKQDLLEAAPGKECFFTQFEINLLRNVLELFYTSCLHLVNKQASNQIPRTVRWDWGTAGHE